MHIGKVSRHQHWSEPVNGYLKRALGSTVIPIYHCGATEAQGVGPEASSRSRSEGMCFGLCKLVASDERFRTPSRSTPAQALAFSNLIRRNAIERHSRQGPRTPSQGQRSLTQRIRMLSRERHSKLVVLTQASQRTQTKAISSNASRFWRLERHIALESLLGPTGACSGRRFAPSEIGAILKVGIGSSIFPI
jgi:hypothetical protein